jgi:hypothetical protein
MKISALYLAAALFLAGVRSQNATSFCDTALYTVCLVNGAMGIGCEGNDAASLCRQQVAMLVLAQHCVLSFCPQSNLFSDLQQAFNGAGNGMSLPPRLGH